MVPNIRSNKGNYAFVIPIRPAVLVLLLAGRHTSLGFGDRLSLGNLLCHVLA